MASQNVAIALDNAEHNRFVVVPDIVFSADEGFVDFDFASEQSAVLPLKRKPNTMKHKPCGLLGNADGPVKFPRGHSVFAVAEHPNGRKPLIQTERGIFKNGPSLQGELPFGVMAGALPLILILKEADALVTAGRTGDTLRPPASHHVSHAVFGFREVEYRFLKGPWFVFHASTIRQKRGFVKYIFTIIAVAKIRLGANGPRVL